MSIMVVQEQPKSRSRVDRVVLVKYTIPSNIIQIPGCEASILDREHVSQWLVVLPEEVVFHKFRNSDIWRQR